MFQKEFSFTKLFDHFSSIIAPNIDIKIVKEKGIVTWFLLFNVLFIYFFLEGDGLRPACMN